MDSAVQPAPVEHPVHYERHRPERTLLYQLVQEYYPAFKAHLEAQGTGLPNYVGREFEDYLKCGRLEHGFMRVRCDTCHAEHLVAFSCKKRGFCRALVRMLAGDYARVTPLCSVLRYRHPARPCFTSRDNVKRLTQLSS